MEEYEEIPEMELIPEWHRLTNCSGTLTFSDDHGWECTLDKNCPMMQQVIRLHSERN